MTVLGIDSSTDRLGIGLAEGNTILSNTILDSMREHASRIIGMIDETLNKADKTINDVEGVAVAVGPGSFTGLRVGLAVGKGIAVARKIPIIGVSTFEVITRRLRQNYPEFYLTAPVRKGELYVFHVTDNSSFPEDIKLMKQENLAEIVKQSPVGIIGRAPDDWNRGIESAIEESNTVISAGELAVLGGERFASGKSDDPITLEPLYIAPTQAEENFARRNRGNS